MNDTTTALARHVAGRIRRWQRRLADRLQAGDTFARQAGWTITSAAFGGRIYRDPRFDQLAASRAPGTSHQVVPPALRPPALDGGALTDTRHQQAASSPARETEPERRNHDRQHR